jgi:hypothetical protein
MNPEERDEYIDILVIIKKACHRSKTIKYLKIDVIDILCECTSNVLCILI